MGAVAQALAQPVPFEFEGKSYQVSPWTFEIQGLFERYLEREAIAACDRNARYLSPEMHQRVLQGVLQDIGSQQYTWGTERVGKALDSAKNVKYIFWLCLKKFDQSVTQDLVERMSKEHYIDMVRSMNLANGATPVPNDEPGSTTMTPSETKGPTA